MRCCWPVVFLVLALGLSPSGAAAGANSDTIQVRVKPQATLIGGSVEVSVRIRCAPFGEPFESNITVTQDNQAIFAQRFLPAVQCNRKWHTVTVVASPFYDDSFHRGPAYASAFVSRVDPGTGEERQGQDVRTIRVR